MKKQKLFLTDIVFIIMILYFGSKLVFKEPVYGIEISKSGCQEFIYEKYKTKPFEDFSLYSFQLNKQNELTEIPKIKKIISALKNNHTKKEGIKINFSNATYQGYISILSIFTENKIEECFFLEDNISYIPVKEYYPAMLTYTYINKYYPPMKIVTTPTP